MIDNLKIVFEAYGGWKALWRSSYIRLSLALMIVSFQIANSKSWPDIVYNILPSILGFSIAAIAIVTVIGDDGFRNSLSKIFTINEKFSDIECLMASFVWFIFVQVSTIIYAIIFKSHPYDACNIFEKPHCLDMNEYSDIVLSYFGTFLTIYSILLVLSSTLLMFQLFRLYVRNIPSSAKPGNDSQKTGEN